MESDRADPPLTVADLDRLAYEWSERRVVMNGIEFAEKADRARLERLKTALPSLLALARRGLEADAAVEHRENILLGKYGTPEGQQAAVIAEQRRAESAESKLAAALAEVERVRGRLEKATEFQEDGPGPNSLGWSIWWHPPARVWVASNCAERFPTLDAAWSAAEAQAGQAAKQGGENVGGNEHGSV